MSSLPTRPTPQAIIALQAVKLARQTQDLPAVPSSALTEPQTDPRLKGQPHTVNVVPSLRGSVLMVGYDRNGDVMVEFRLPANRYRPKMAARLEQWVRENDAPALTLI